MNHPNSLSIAKAIGLAAGERSMRAAGRRRMNLVDRTRAFAAENAVVRMIQSLDSEARRAYRSFAETTAGGDMAPADVAELRRLLRDVAWAESWSAIERAHNETTRAELHTPQPAFPADAAAG